MIHGSLGVQLVILASLVVYRELPLLFHSLSDSLLTRVYAIFSGLTHLSSDTEVYLLVPGLIQLDLLMCLVLSPDDLPGKSHTLICGLVAK